jgi:hypothetical protein
MTASPPRCTPVHAFARETLHGVGGAAGGTRAGLTPGVTFSDLFTTSSRPIQHLGRQLLERDPAWQQRVGCAWAER